MAHQFEVGDLAIVVGRPPECKLPEVVWADYTDYTGRIVTILSPLQSLNNIVSGRKALVHEVDIAAGLGIICFEPQHLRPYYDGMQKAKWDEETFKPKETINV